MTATVKTRIRKDDEVIIIAGRDKGARGKVIRVLPQDSSVLVAKVNMIKRHTRQTENSAGGIIDKEAPLAISNVQYFCAKCKAGVRLAVKTLEDGRKVRTCCKCGEVLDR
ncbi:50S ribosomal protein L24 [Mariprofundus ferrooxydans]|uniref:Large ribosomal subunit protein uL24 n=1 Tax=Mariprofundus ferrooxydans PV-1 TaxID=314345 RepID=Q0EW47_9PROT|nr:50S ribosomal protein L24 [Mariprofundus ferrooxydans]EAU53508.1 ribosomal protein L24 [Mariprofundus ferrooxydans PV-1]KON46379.1 50S ribosomal protein L24 [Mariprofundus ferrooxydans]